MKVIMKKSIVTALVIGASMAIATAAPPLPHHVSARPISNVTVTKSDRAFLTDIATDIILQKTAAETLLTFTDDPYFTESARFTLKTLEEIEPDLNALAKDRAVALPLAGTLEQPRDFNRFMNSRNGAFQREYEQYTRRNTRRLADRFRRASNDADDAEVRAFALRHFRWLETAHHETRGLEGPRPSGFATRKVATGRVAEIFEPPTSVPLAAVQSPASPGGSQ
jgi:hypothetical protein